MEDARRAAELAARNSYGRLLAILASRSGDIAAAEDALAEAFAAALRTWPEHGVPHVPDAWLLTAARRSLGHMRSRSATAAAGGATMALIEDERHNEEAVPFGDERLKLMFACAHPAIDPAVQAPLMLQTVLGLDASRIASSFLVSPAAMGQKLVRAKTKIRDAGIAFVIPDAGQIAERIAVVLDAIYAAYGTGWEDVLGIDARRSGLSSEAIWLGRLVADRMPGDPEAMGLLSLMLHCEARRPARRDATGSFVPLHAQDASIWDRKALIEAERLLRAAARYARPGRFQTEAAIQSLHAQSVMTGEYLTGALVGLYDLLVAIAPTIGARVARAVALAEHGAVDQALAELAEIAPKADYQPWWAARARVLWLSGDKAGAGDAATRAAGLSDDPSVRAFLIAGGAFQTRAAPASD